MDGEKCRLCLRLLIENKIFCDPTIAKNIQSCCKIRVEAGDKLEKNICNLCYDKLSSIIEYRIKTEKNDRILRECTANRAERKQYIEVKEEKRDESEEEIKYGFEVPIVKREPKDESCVMERLKDKPLYSDIRFLPAAPNNILVKEEEKCRLCLKNDIDVKIYCDNLVAEKIEACCNIRMDCNDNLPKYICGVCLARLDDIIDFINDCDYNDKFSRDRINYDESKELDNNHDSLIMPPPKTILSKRRKVPEIKLGEASIVKKETDQISDETNKFTCNVCGKRFKTNSTFSRHIKNVHQLSNKVDCELCGKTMKKPFLKYHMPEVKWEKQFECEICSVGFFSKNCLRIHISRHLGLLPPVDNMRFSRNLHIKSIGDLKFDSMNGESSGMNIDKIYQCDFCKKSFSSKKYLGRHVKTHTGDKQYKCRYCDARFILNQRRKFHEMSHTGNYPHRCPVCNKGFGELFIMKRHLLMHTGEKPYECGICNTRFAQKYTLKRHEAMHQDEKYNCDICKKGCIDLASFDLHMKKHAEEEKAYRCANCDYSFDDLELMEEHLKSHSDDVPHGCKLCDAIFFDKDTLKRHERTSHTPRTLHHCPICDKGYIGISAMKTHLMKHTGEKPYKCKFCCAKFPQKYRLQRHEMLHTGDKPHQCPVCNKGYTNSSALKVHLMTHTGERPFKCKYCESTFDKKYTLQRHEMWHTGEKPHHCSVCNKGFIHLANMKLHFSNRHKGIDFVYNEKQE